MTWPQPARPSAVRPATSRRTATGRGRDSAVRRQSCIAAPHRPGASAIRTRRNPSDISVGPRSRQELGSEIVLRSTRPEPNSSYIGVRLRTMRASPVQSAMAVMGLVDEPGSDRAGARQERRSIPTVAQGRLDGEGVTVRLPEPRLRDGQDAEAQRRVAGGGRLGPEARGDGPRNSVTAPYIIKVHDVKAGDANDPGRRPLVRRVMPTSKQVDPAKEAAKHRPERGRGGQQWSCRPGCSSPTISDAAGITPPGTRRPGPKTWYSHVHGRLLDRIDVRRDEPGDGDPDRRDRWWSPRGPTRRSTSRGRSPTAGSPSRRRQEEGRTAGPLKPYAGGISYAKISRLAFRPRGTARRDARGLRRAAGMVPGRADPAVEVQRRRPGPDPKTAAGAGAKKGK